MFNFDKTLRMLATWALMAVPILLVAGAVWLAGRLF